MLLVQISDSSWIDQLSEQLLEIHYDQISIRMSMSDFYSLSSLFDLSMEEEMFDADVCSVTLLSKGNYIVAYRSFTMTMCEYALGRFAELCFMGIEQLKNNNKFGHLSIVPCI